MLLYQISLSELISFVNKHLVLKFALIIKGKGKAIPLQALRVQEF
jgi:hypothetical protein